MRSKVRPIDWNSLYDSDKLPEAEGEMFCTTDVCEVPDAVQ
jgi:hypothetical protein